MYKKNIYSKLILLLLNELLLNNEKKIGIMLLMTKMDLMDYVVEVEVDSSMVIHYCCPVNIIYKHCYSKGFYLDE